MFWMSSVADGFEVVGIPGRTSNILWRAAASGLEQEGEPLCRGVVEPFFELDHMIPAVGLANDIAEPRLAGVDGLGTKIAIGIRDALTSFASQELEEMAVGPAERPPEASDAAYQGVA